MLESCLSWNCFGISKQQLAVPKPVFAKLRPSFLAAANFPKLFNLFLLPCCCSNDSSLRAIAIVSELLQLFQVLFLPLQLF
jgi:hypothetical protein